MGINPYNRLKCDKDSSPDYPISYRQHGEPKDGTESNNKSPNFNIANPIIILVWNYRGCAREDFRVALKDLIATHKPNIIMLTETRIDHYLLLLKTHKHIKISPPFRMKEICSDMNGTGKEANEVIHGRVIRARARRLKHKIKDWQKEGLGFEAIVFSRFFLSNGERVLPLNIRFTSLDPHRFSIRVLELKNPQQRLFIKGGNLGKVIMSTDGDFVGIRRQKQSKIRLWKSTNRICTY
ncbi:hypothetical protein M9H77_03265 [Catharanthus roseus]|uniref:Uncharacterized protein n=1 Tax=Catharanthus roseus TaxID=4058 RepID=A0ACC0CAX6_CATRO|nr:hypothetical protein M9H77_03265 [Catharanthus roseus]